MGLKKYEIITVGGNKRVRALRSWQVGGRYVNIGDVGGIVYDEKTLSQDGLCWLFKGNFGFPGARISGDSIVDVLEDAMDAAGAANVDILGSSVLVGAKLKIGARQGSADNVVLTAADFEQGGVAYIVGANLETQKIGSAQSLRTKSPIFLGGVIKSLKLEVPGYKVRAIGLDRDLNMVNQSAYAATGVGVTLVTSAAQYCVLILEKNPLGVIVPADATAAQITYTATYDAKLVIVDSRVELNTATAQGAIMIRPGGETATAPGATYPDTIIKNSNVVINGHATALRTVSLISEFTGCNVFIDAKEGDPQAIGLYRNVKNLAIAGSLTSSAGEDAQSIIQVTDCDNFAVSPTIFPGVSAAKAASMPFIFQGCNVPDGRFYHHAQIANTYRNIDFALANEDLGKSGTNAHILVSSEIEGMYRLYSATAASFGAVVESYESIRDSGIGRASIAATYGTTIYKDAYFNGEFELAGTNVFGSKAPSHPVEQVLNVQPRVVQGTFNTVTVGEAITGVVPDATRVSIPTRIRLNRHDGVTVHLPAGLEAKFMTVDPNDRIVAASVFVKGEASASYTSRPFAFIQFRKTGDAAITPEDLAGVTMTVYNGCKISKSSSTTVAIKGNVRVEDNATIYNANIMGTGYFGGNSIVYRDPASINFFGAVHMKDNAVFAPKSLTGHCALIRMEGNAKFVGSVVAASVYISFIMAGNAIIEGTINTRSGVVMYGNSRVTSTGTIADTSRGTLVMMDNASIEANTTVIGAITLAGNYKGDKAKTWVGKRTITDVNEPEYDNNVKSKYDL